MKDQTNEESLDPVPGELPDTAGRPGAASAQHVEKNGAAPVDPDALFRQVLDGANLNLAWKQVKANKGAAGVDGRDISAFTRVFDAPRRATAHDIAAVHPSRLGLCPHTSG